MKTRNLTQSRLRNDPINRRIHGFSFRDFEDEDGVQDMISPHSFNQFLISNAPRMRKWVKKRKKSMDAWIVVSKEFDFTPKSKGQVRSRRTVLFKEKLGVTVRSNCPSWSTAEMMRRLIKTVRLSCIRSIVWRRDASIHHVRWIFIKQSWLIIRSIGRYESRPL